jgi:hypothetical protein
MTRIHSHQDLSLLELMRDKKNAMLFFLYETKPKFFIKLSRTSYKLHDCVKVRLLASSETFEKQICPHTQK